MIHEERASVLDCGDERSGVTAFASSAPGLRGFITVLSSMSIQSGDSADSVAAVQNLAAVRKRSGKRETFLKCARTSDASASFWRCILFTQRRNDFEFIITLGLSLVWW